MKKFYLENVIVRWDRWVFKTSGYIIVLVMWVQGTWFENCSTWKDLYWSTADGEAQNTEAILFSDLVFETADAEKN